MADNEERTKQDRTARSSNTREAAARRPQSWRPPSALPTPQVPENDGYVYRWIRTKQMGEDDPRNVNMKFQEGWEPVDPKELPDFDDNTLNAINRNESDSGQIAVGGLVLCRMPKEFLAQRTDYYTKRNEAQLQAVDDSLMNEQADERMPIHAPSRKTSFGSRE